ncbi:MAG: UDP-N-acetylmuramate--L-alanine ligase [Ignavibacteria bacterium]|nr:UDP-N-acetylmuramate--L-alanine ligase [Ignavibacteria bacterium]
MINDKTIFGGAQKIHLTGIGGIGMSGIAEYLVKHNFRVTGSDMNLSPLTKKLENLGVKIFQGHSKNNLPDDTDLLIYTSAVKEDNEELAKASGLKIRKIKRAEALGNIVNHKFLIAVSGTHGKTTTSAMIAKVLIDNKFDPTVFVGGSLDFLDGNSSRSGKSEFAVAEADEYDRSFHQLKADIAVITNIEPDHLDIYRDIEDIKNSFRQFLSSCKKDSVIIACGDDENVREVLTDFKNVIFYGFRERNDYVIKNINYENGKAGFMVNGEEIFLKVAGNHNILNSAAAFLAAKQLKISSDNFNSSMNDFHGVKRRLELKFENGIVIYDDYAHHPTEVKASLEAIRKMHSGKIITIFQPHLYTRTRDFYIEFGDAFRGTDILFLTKIYPARETEIEGVSSSLILNEFLKSDKKGYYIENREELLSELSRIIQDGDILIFQGAGDITEMCDRFVKISRKKRNAKVPL